MSDTSPSFLAVGRPGSRPPRLYGQLLRGAKLDKAYVERVVKQDELFEQRAPCEDDEGVGRAYKLWLMSLTAGLGLVWDDKLVAMPTYLEFKSVGWHTDGVLMPFGMEEDEYRYVNLQLAGSGTLEVKEIDGSVASGRVVPGDLYMFDQRLDHQWVSEGAGMCKAFSIALRVREAEMLATSVLGRSVASHVSESGTGVRLAGEKISSDGGVEA